MRALSRLAQMASPTPFAPRFGAVVGDRHVITEPEQLRVYDCDGLTGWRAQPELVALPGSTAEVQAVVRICAREGLPFVARGAGTGLSGGALPVADGDRDLARADEPDPRGRPRVAAGRRSSRASRTST